MFINLIKNNMTFILKKENTIRCLYKHPLTFSFVFLLQYVKIKRARVLSTGALCVRRHMMGGRGRTAPSTVASVQVQTALCSVTI